MKKILLATSVFAALSMSGIAQAGNTIEFLGEITDSTCDVALEGGGTTVILPTVSKALLPAANATAGRTMFALVASNCELGETKSKVAAFFNASNGADGTADANNVDSASGYLNNIDATAGAAENVQLRLIDGTGGNPIKVGYMDQVTGTGASGYVTVDASGNARMPYAVEYISTNAATPGPVRGVVVYDLMYQ